MSTNFANWSRNVLALEAASTALGKHRQGRVWGEPAGVFLSFTKSLRGVGPFGFRPNIRAAKGEGRKLSRHRDDGS